MEIRAILVAVGFGLVVGLALGRYREERRPILGSFLATALAGGVAWLAGAGENLAAPSLLIGGLSALAGAAVTSRIAIP